MRGNESTWEVINNLLDVQNHLPYINIFLFFLQKNLRENSFNSLKFPKQIPKNYESIQTSFCRELSFLAPLLAVML